MAKEKSITELKDERNQLLKRTKELIEGAKKENRQFNEAENKEYNEIQMDVRSILIEIQEHEFLNRQKGTPQTDPGKGTFSLRRAILAHVNGQQQRDAESAAIDEATKAHRGVPEDGECGSLIIPMEVRAAYTAGTEAATGVVIDEDQMELLLPLESNLVLTRAGARMMTGLKGDIYWPSHTGTQVFWQGENEEAQDGAGTFTKGTIFQPKRLTAFIDISKQLLVQENRSVEALIRQLMAVRIAQKIEQTAFAKDAHVDGVPDGLFQAAPTITGNLDWASVVAMETKADLNNALFGNLAYIMHPSLVGKAKTKVKDASGAGGFIFGENGTGMLNGYRALRTNNVPTLGDGNTSYGAIFGNWSDFFIGQWGAIDITVDPYTLSTKGMIRLVFNSYWNMGKVRTESFVTGSFA
jgi:HK97 family phage major capsid protein